MVILVWLVFFMSEVPTQNDFIGGFPDGELFHMDMEVFLGGAGCFL